MTNLLLCGIICNVVDAALAQLDRVPGYEPVGRGFESLMARQRRAVVETAFFCYSAAYAAYLNERIHMQPNPEPEPDSLFASIIFIIILVAFSGFFSATETAFSSLNRTKLKLKAQDGNKAAKNALALSENFDKLLSTILVGNNIVNITLSVLFNNIFEKLHVQYLSLWNREMRGGCGDKIFLISYR